MAFPTFTPPVRQSPGSKDTPEVKVKAAGFGDGYTQTAPDGLNNVREVWALEWDTLLPEQAKAITDQLKAWKGTQPFKYDVDEGDVRNWTCVTYDRTRGEVHQVTATFREYFGVET